MWSYSSNFWDKKKHEQRNPEDIEARELNEYICEFILRVKRGQNLNFQVLEVCFQV